MTNLGRVAITSGEARQQILDELAEAIEQIGFAAGRLGEAYEALSVGAADRMEAELYMPVQKAFGRGKRAYSQYAERSGLSSRSFAPPPLGVPHDGARGWIAQAVEAAASADYQISDLQDSEIAIEFGDPELRAGLSETRALLGKLPGAAANFMRSFGR
jgi:hypothetical protein